MTNIKSITAAILAALFAVGTFAISAPAFSESSNCVQTHDFEKMTEAEIEEAYRD